MIWFTLRYLAATFGVLLLEGTIVRRMAIGGARPDMRLAHVVYAGLAGGGRGGVTIGLLIGLLRDCADPERFGLEALLMSLVGFAAGSTSPVVNRTHPLVQALLIFALLLGHDLARALAVTGFAPGEALGLWLRASPATAAYTAIIAPLAAALLPRLWAGRRGRALS
jgi:rod shape-determining protein MreD